MTAGEHHAVVNRLVAVAIEEQLLAGSEQRLEDDLVRGRCAVRGKEGAPRAERLGRDRLRLGDHARRLHQRVEHLYRYRQVAIEDVLAHEVVEIVDPGTVAQRLARRVPGRVPGVLRHPYVVLELVVERRPRPFLDLRVEDAVHAAVVALLAVEVAVDRLGEQRVDDLVFVLLGDEDVDVELGTEAGDPPHQFERRHFLLRAVVDHHRLQVAVLLDCRERLARRRDPGKGDAEGIVERARRRVQPLDELLQDEGLVVDDQDPADRFFH